MNRPQRGISLIAVVSVACTTAVVARGGDLANYELPDRSLAVAMVDSSERESFLGVHVDAEGRLFVGGREAVFAYDPDGKGGFRPPVELFRFPPDSWVYDLAVRGDDLYVQTVTTLFVLPGGRVKREGVTAKPLLWGIAAGSAGQATYGVHQGLHGLAWGPDGDLRVSFGDCVWDGSALAQATRVGHCFLYSRDGEKMPLTATGGIVRVRPDGTPVRLVASGLRNPCGLAYDSDWNLFTHDNDHEGQPVDFVPGRLLHVFDGADFAWPRGWTPAKTPDRRELLETMVDDLGRTIPVGQTWYDEPLLRQACGRTILLARWCTSTVSAFPTWPHGATFRARERILLQGKNFMRPVGVAVAPDGRIFVTTCGMRGNEVSPVYASDLLVISAAGSPPLLDRQVSLVDADLDALFGLLGGDSWRLRQGAHEELLRRDVPAQEFVSRWDRSAVTRSYDREHLLWLVGLRAEASIARDRLVKALDDTVPSIRLQAVRCLAERFPGEVRDLLPLLAADPDPQVRHAVVLACFAAPALDGDASVVAAIVDGPARSDDTYLRQAATRLLAEKASVARLAELAASDDAATRLAAILALGRRLTVPPTDFVPPKELSLGGVLGPKIHHEGKIVDLREVDRIGFFTVPAYWAGIREQRAADFDLLAKGLADPDEAVRRQAAFFLSMLDDPRTKAAAAEVLAAAAAARKPATAPAPAEAADPALAARLTAPGAGGPEELKAMLAVDWRRSAADGDAANGRRLFQSIGCGKCHAVSLDSAVAGGPSLAGVGRRYAPEYLAESVIVPSRQVAELFRGTTIVTDGGQVVSGLVVAETATELEILQADATHRTIPKDQIEERAEAKVSPMPQGLVKTPDELRDILAYLLGPEVN